MHRLRNLLSYISALGVPVVHNSEVIGGLLAGLMLDDTGYSIHLSQRASLSPPEILTVILSHELSHLLRGDLIIQKEKRLEATAWNVASDAAINSESMWELLTKYFVKPENADKGKGFILYRKLHEAFPETLPEVFPGTLQLYKLLLDNGIVPPDSFQGLLVLGKDEDLDERKRQHISTSIKARTLLKNPDFKDIPGCLTGYSPLSISSNFSTLARGTYNPEMIPAIDHILEAVEGFDGAMAFTRTWSRPPRTGYTSGVVVKGALYSPRPKVALLVDMSGSMTAFAPALAALADELSQRYDPLIVIHDDKVLYSGPTFPLELNWGGGTSFVEAYETAAAFNPDVLIHATDGETGDLSQIKWPTNNVVWVLPSAYMGFKSGIEGHVYLDAKI